jgi:hypothetical protein
VNVSWSAAEPDMRRSQSAHKGKKYRKRYVRGCWFRPSMTIRTNFGFENRFGIVDGFEYSASICSVRQEPDDANKLSVSQVLEISVFL